MFKVLFYFGLLCMSVLAKIKAVPLYESNRYEILALSLHPRHKILALLVSLAKMKFLEAATTTKSEYSSKGIQYFTKFPPFYNNSNLYKHLGKQIRAISLDICLGCSSGKYEILHNFKRILETSNNNTELQGIHNHIYPDFLISSKPSCFPYQSTGARWAHKEGPQTTLC